MSAAAVAARGARRAEALMTAPCLIERETGDMAVDPVTGAVTPVYAIVYDGRCKLNTYEPYEQDRDVAGSTTVVQRYSLHIPVGAPGVAVGDLARVDGRRFRVAGTHLKTFQTAQRLLVDEMTAGAQ